MRASLISCLLLGVACSSPPPGAGAGVDGGGGDPGADGGASSPDGGGEITARCDGLEMPEGSDMTWTLESGGRERTFRIHLPPSYDPEIGTPLVLDFHGFGSNAVQQELLSHMPSKADDEGFIAVHAEGVGLMQSWNAGACCGTAVSEDVDDVAFVEAMLDKLEESLCIDPARVYVTGMSNGGFFSHRLACELSDRIAAVAPVAGPLGIESCDPGRPVPIMHFHGTADGVVPYDGSDTLGFPAVEDTMDGWAERNGCSQEREEILSKGDSTCEQYKGCPDNGPVVLCTVEGGGHTWPGGTPVPVLGKTTTDISATDLMWSFFVEHPLP